MIGGLLAVSVDDDTFPVVNASLLDGDGGVVLALVLSVTVLVVNAVVILAVAKRVKKLERGITVAEVIVVVIVVVVDPQLTVMPSGACPSGNLPITPQRKSHVIITHCFTMTNLHIKNCSRKSKVSATVS